MKNRTLFIAVQAALFALMTSHVTAEITANTTEPVKPEPLVTTTQDATNISEGTATPAAETTAGTTEPVKPEPLVTTTPEGTATPTEDVVTVTTTSPPVVDVDLDKLDTLDAEAISALPIELIKVLTPEQFAKISEEAIAGLTLEQGAILGVEQVVKLTVEQLEALNVEVALILAEAQLESLTEDQKATIPSLDSLDAETISKLSTDFISILTLEQASALKAEQVAALTLEQLAALNIEVVSSLTEDQVAELTAEQLKSLPSLAGLDAEAIAGLSVEFVASLSAEELAKIPVEAIEGLTEKQVTAIVPKALAGITLEQAAKLTAAQLVALTVEQLKALSVDIASSLTEEQVADLSDEQKAALPQEEAVNLAELDAEAIGELTVEFIATLDAEQIATITVEAIVGLSAEQVAALSLEAVVGLTADQIAAITVEAIVGFTVEQLEKLAEVKLAGAFTAEQVAKLSSEQRLPLFTTNGKVMICHTTGLEGRGNPHVIEVSESAVSAHLAHNDTIGAVDCPMDIKQLTAKDVSTLPIVFVASLTAEQVAQLPVEALVGLTAAQIEALIPLAKEGSDDGSDGDSEEDISDEQIALILGALTPEQIGQLSLEFVAALSADQIALLSVEAVAGFTVAQIKVISVKAVIGFTVVQLANIAPKAKAGFTAEQSDALSEKQVVALAGDAEIDEEAAVEDIETVLGELDESNPLQAFIKVKWFLSLDTKKLEVKFEKKFGKDFAKQLEEFYKAHLPKGWKVKVKFKDGKYFFKVKVKKHQHIKFGFFKFVSVNFAPSLDLSLDAEEGETEADVAEQVAALPEDVAGALTEEQLTEDLPAGAVTALQKNETVATKIFLSLNVQTISPANLLKFLPVGWELDVKTKKVKLDKGKVKALPVGLLTGVHIALFEPIVIGFFEAQQISQLKPEAVAAITPEMVVNIDLSALAGFTAPQVGAISVEALEVFTKEMIVALNPAVVVTGFKADQLHGIGRQKVLELFTYPQLVQITGTNTVLADLGIEIPDNTTSDGGSDDDGDDGKSDGGSDGQPDDDGDDGESDGGSDDGQPDDDTDDGASDGQSDGGSDEVVDATGKIKLPKVTVNLPKILLPILSNLGISISVEGTVIQGGVLPLLSETLVALGFADFSTLSQVNGVLFVKGIGNAQGIGFAFLPPQDKHIKKVGKGKPKLDVDKHGKYAITSALGLEMTLVAAPKDPALLLDAVGGETAGAEVEIKEDGTAVLAIPEVEADVACTFDPMVEPAEEGAEVGVTMEGEPGVDEVATVVYEDGTQQTLYPATADQESLDAAAEEVVTGIELHYYSNGKVYFAIDGWELVAIPEFAVTKVKNKPAKPVISVLVPGKLAELITVEGKRQLFHISVIGEAPASEEVTVEEGAADSTTEVTADGTAAESTVEEGADESKPKVVDDPAGNSTAAPVKKEVATEEVS